jgi:predicted aspartyl protease
MKMKALLDSGANAIYIDKAYAQKMKLPLTLLANPILVYNVDGTRNPPDQSLIVLRLYSVPGTP